MGVNGAGKSTFAKLLAGALQIEHGAMMRSPRMKVGWFHQHQIEALDADDTPIEIIRRALPEDGESRRRGRLAASSASAPRRSRPRSPACPAASARACLLNLVAMEAPHLLILDEPTNHLDIDSRRALLDALNDYEGAVILITHDRSLMELVADRLWLADGGTIKPYDGDMDDYAKMVLDRARIAARAPTQVREAEPVRARAEARQPAEGSDRQPAPPGRSRRSRPGPRLQGPGGDRRRPHRSQDLRRTARPRRRTRPAKGRGLRRAGGGRGDVARSGGSL